MLCHKSWPAAMMVCWVYIPAEFPKGRLPNGVPGRSFADLVAWLHAKGARLREMASLGWDGRGVGGRKRDQVGSEGVHIELRLHI
mmetsp:Transcript_79939/g.171269  ORF Transcript_79939/g.171269 Transcript_79939/m.171269 type:complete len:85 (-) Transcript_79939:235-489(-)